MENREIMAEIQRTIKIEAAFILKLNEILDAEAVIATVKAIAACKGRIVLTGCGTSACAARKAAHSLCCIERPALFLSPSDAVHGGLGVLQPDDILILISKGGNTSELAAMIPTCKTKGAMLIGVTENRESEIARCADIVLIVSVDQEPCRFNMLATASTLAVIAVFDAICIALMKATGFSKEQFLVIHPGGAVGMRLQNEKD